MKAIILILRVSLGIFWLWEGLSKWIYGFDAKAFLQSVLTNPAVVSTSYAGHLLPLVEWLAKAGTPVVNVVIPVAEIVLGAWFLYGKKIRAAALGQAGMSLLFVTCGAIGWNPLLLATSTLLLVLLVPQMALNN